MDFEKKTYLISKISVGNSYFEYYGTKYKIVPPTLEQIYLSEKIYDQEYEQLAYEGMLSKKQALDILIVRGKWNDVLENSFEKIEKAIDKLKIDLYKKFLNKSLHSPIKSQIRALEKNLAKVHDLKGSLDYLTKEYHCTTLKHQFIISVCIQDMNGNYIYNPEDFWISNGTMIEKALMAKSSEIVSQSEFRELARSNPWRNYWNISKENVFKRSSLELTNEQRTLVTYSKMYDNAYQHPECPPDEVIQDDDIFDGWTLFQQEKREKETKKKQIDDMVDGKSGGGKEVFVPVGKDDDPSQVYELNELDSRRRIRIRQDVAKRGERIEEQKLPDIQEDFRKQMAEQRRNR